MKQYVKGLSGESARHNSVSTISVEALMNNALGQGRINVSDQQCLIQDCTARVYAPAGTGSLCKNHFLDFVRWRRRKGASMFRIYGAMTMAERDTVVTEWSRTVKVE